MKKDISKEAYFKRLQQLGEVHKPAINELQRSLGTLIDYKRAADGVAYGIIKEQHHYYIKKSGLKEDPNVSDFAYIGGLGNITNYQYKKLSEADKQRNMMLKVINESVTTKVSKTGSKKRLNEDKAGDEIEQAASKIGDLDAATATAEVPAGPAPDLGGGEMPPAPEGEPIPEPAPEGEPDLDGGDLPPAPEGGEGEPAPDGGEGEPAPEGGEGEPAPDGGDVSSEDEKSMMIKDIEKNLGKITEKIRKTELDEPQVNSYLKSFIAAFKEKLKNMDIEERREIADLIIKVVPDEEIQDLGSSVPQDDETEGGVEEGQMCAECGGFGKYAESRGYATPESVVECGEEEVGNLISGYANAHNDGMNDGDLDTVGLLIKVVNPELLGKLKGEYGHDEYADELAPKVDGLTETTVEEGLEKLKEAWGGTDPGNVEVQPPVMKEDGEDDSLEDEAGETPEEEKAEHEPDDEEFEVEDEKEPSIFGPESQSLGVGVVKPDGAPTTGVEINITPDKAVNISMNEAKQKLIKQIAEGVNAYLSEALNKGKNKPFVKAAPKAKILKEEDKPSAGLSKEKKSSIVKSAKAGKDIGEKGKNFDKVADKAAEKYGSKEKGEKVAAAAMWKNVKREGEEPKKVMSEAEQRLRKYVRNHIEESVGMRKPLLTEDKKSEKLQKLDKMIDEQIKLFESIGRKKFDSMNEGLFSAFQSNAQKFEKLNPNDTARVESAFNEIMADALRMPIRKSVANNMTPTDKYNVLKQGYETDKLRSPSFGATRVGTGMTYKYTPFKAENPFAGGGTGGNMQYGGTTGT
jgi:hypothetical protein